MFKYKIPQILQFLTPSITWRVKSPGKSVYLTFDDGPHPEITPWVLSVLSQFNAKATFFCVGENVTKFPATYHAVLKAGHTVGNHSFNHLNGWKTVNESYFENISKCAEVVHSDLFRPPFGRIKFSQIKKLKQQFRIIMWEVLSRDYEKNLDTNDAIRKLKRYIRKGSVIVFHDSAKAEQNLKIILPGILQYLHNNGFEMKSL